VVACNKGSWRAISARTVEVTSSAPSNCSGDNPSIPVRTRYTFFESGAGANEVRIERTWSFAANQTSSNPAQGMRAYVPRLNSGTYGQVMFPKADHSLLTEGVSNDSFRTDWDGSWIALNASSTNAGALLLRDPADTGPAQLVSDYDSSSGSNNSGITLNRPQPDGWLAPVTETEYMCFYDATTWPVEGRSATNLPEGCGVIEVPINLVAPKISAGAGNPQPGHAYTATAGSWEHAGGGVARQWYRCLGTSCEAIGGATNAQYTATGADVGHALKVTETATAASGESDSASSNIAGTVSGTIYQNAESEPNELPGAPVQACPIGGGACRSTTSGAHGRYTIQVPVSGEYAITAFPPSSSEALPKTRPGVSTIADEADTPNQNVVLAIPQAPPPNVGFGGSGYRGTTGNGTPVVHWQEPFVIEYETGIEDEVEVTVRFPNEEERTYPPAEPVEPDPEDPGTGHFRFPIEPLYPNHGPAEVSIKDKPPGEPEEETDFPIYIDPSGFVHTTDGAPLAGVTVTLYRSDSESGPFTAVPDGSAVMSPMNRANPDLSGADGHFGWDVIAGYYKVRAEKSGCHAPGDPGQAFVETEVQTIPPPVTNLDIRLDCSPLLTERPGARLRPSLGLSRGGKVRVKKSGFFKVGSATIECPAASALSCTAQVTVTGPPPKRKKVKRKGGSARAAKAGLKLGSSKMTIAPGARVQVAGRLSAKGLRKLGALHSVKAKIAIQASVPNGDSVSGDVSAILLAPPGTR
jgi:hypothetical protein